MTEKNLAVIIKKQEQFVGVNSDALSLLAKQGFGSLTDGRFTFSLFEVVYLLRASLIEVVDSKGTEYDLTKLERFATKNDKDFMTKLSVFSDLRARGYTVKTALKFGADFRVYNKGATLGDEHARWIVFCTHESKRFTWQDFSAKNRVAHSTKKNLLIGVVDTDGDVTYYEVAWVKP